MLFGAISPYTLASPTSSAIAYASRNASERSMIDSVETVDSRLAARRSSDRTIVAAFPSGCALTRTVLTRSLCSSGCSCSITRAA
jgi:hypothetical protein